MTKYVIFNGELYHYGIKGKSGRYPLGSGENPYQDYPHLRKKTASNKTVFDDELKNINVDKLMRNAWRLETTGEVGGNKDVSISLCVEDYDRMNNLHPDAYKFAKIADNFIKKYNDSDIREGIAKHFYDEIKPWVNDDPSTAVTRDEFLKNIKLGALDINPQLNRFEAYYSDGGAYECHSLIAMGNLDDGKADWFTM